MNWQINRSGLSGGVSLQYNKICGYNNQAARCYREGGNLRRNILFGVICGCCDFRIG